MHQVKNDLTADDTRTRDWVEAPLSEHSALPSLQLLPHREAERVHLWLTGLQM